MTLDQIYAEHKPGTISFDVAIFGYCNLGLTITEIRRIALYASNPEAFKKIYYNSIWWKDDKRIHDKHMNWGN